LASASENSRGVFFIVIFLLGRPALTLLTFFTRHLLRRRCLWLSVDGRRVPTLLLSLIEFLLIFVLELLDGRVFSIAVAITIDILEGDLHGPFLLLALDIEGFRERAVLVANLRLSVGDLVD